MMLRRTAIVLILAGALPVGTVPLAHAAFGAGAASESAFSSDALLPPTSLSASLTCTVNVLNVVLAASVQLSWTPSATAWSGGQRVVVRDGLGAVVGTKDVSASTSSTSANLPLVLGGTYTATVQAVYGNWSSAPASATTAGC